MKQVHPLESMNDKLLANLPSKCPVILTSWSSFTLWGSQIPKELFWKSSHYFSGSFH